MNRTELHGMWNYFLMLESDLDNTSRFIEPAGQENTYSFEFAKLLILACTEVESVFKAICRETKGEEVEGSIATYKEVILGKYPKIVETAVNVKRLGYNIEPFKGWDTGRLEWWGSYQHVKHSRGHFFAEATYFNAVSALAALYILIFYLGKITNIEFDNYTSKYIDSDYAYGHIIAGPFKKLPDFETKT